MCRVCIERDSYDKAEIHKTIAKALYTKAASTWVCWTINFGYSNKFPIPAPDFLFAALIRMSLLRLKQRASDRCCISLNGQDKRTSAQSKLMIRRLNYVRRMMMIIPSWIESPLFILRHPSRIPPPDGQIHSRRLRLHRMIQDRTHRRVRNYPCWQLRTSSIRDGKTQSRVPEGFRGS
jgi:hypothetical protein